MEANFSAEGADIRMKFAGSGHGAGLRLRRRGEHQNREKKGRLFQATLPFCTVFCWIRQFSAASQCHADRQDIHTVGGVEGDLSNRLADDGCKVRIIGIEAQLGTMPDVVT